MTVKFATRFAQKLEEAPPSRKSDRTRERLKLSAVRILEKKGYNQVRVIDITTDAELSEGSFYTYYDDKREICMALLSEFMHFIPTQRHRAMSRGGTLFETIRHANVVWVETAKSNAGLLRCLFQLQDSDNEFASILRRVNQDWYEWVAERIISRYPEGAIDLTTLTLTIYALGAMMDEITRSAWINPDANLLGLLKKLSLDDEGLAELLSLIWHRSLYPGVEIEGAQTPAVQSLIQLDAILKESKT